MARRPFRGARGPRRMTQWVRAADVTVLTPLAANAAIIDQSLGGITEPVTVVRVRGSIWVKSDQTSQDEVPFGAVGCAVVSDQAVAIGVTAVPTPIADANSDLWLMHRYFAMSGYFVSGGAEHVDGWQFDFDSKAMRKIPTGSTLSFTVENASSAFGLEYLLQFAALIKLA